VAVLIMLMWGATLVALCAVVLTAPKWCFRSLARYRLWGLWDEIDDDVVGGRLPAEAVVELRHALRRSIKQVSKMRLLEALLFYRLAYQGSPAPRDSPSGLTEPQRERLRRHEEQHGLFLLSALLLGSWIGVAVALWTFLAVSVRGHSRGSMGETAKAASKTAFGARALQGAMKAASCPSPV
jgi:hypothetical protein